jgi:FkbH-like protein
VSLNMRMQVQPFDETGRARIAQLIAKSNQFNLTTRRYNEAEVARIESDPDCFALQIRLSDCFGDNGMICVVICRERASEWEIDTWLMSCRVLNRKVEQAVTEVLCAEAAARGMYRLVGWYLPTERNELVKDHYEKLGFSLIERKSSGATMWALEVNAVLPQNLPIEICCNGFLPPARERGAGQEVTA